MRATPSPAGCERRSPTARRLRNLIDPAVEPRGDRRRDERRDCPRAEARFWVKDPTHGGISEVFEGELSAQGASFLAMHPPHSERLEMGMWLPGCPHELRTQARVVRRSRYAGTTAVHLRFEQMSPDFCSALALYLVEQESLSLALRPGRLTGV